MRGRASIVVVLMGAMLIGGSGIRAFADVTNSTGTNVQSGDNRGNTSQGGKSGSGDAVGGQVTGVVSSGRTSVDATNVSKDSSVESGDAHASNTSRTFVGQATSSDDITVGPADLSFVTVGETGNLQDGNNRQTISQTANATTGDGVAGEVIGVVTAAGGTASVVAANASSNSDVTTGDAYSTNDSTSFVGQAINSDGSIFVADISNVTAPDEVNIQSGNNRQTAGQSATSTTGDGVAGQVLGVVSAGRTSVDATNTSDNVSVETGDATSDNASVSFVGQALSDSGSVNVGPADITNVSADENNTQDGSNRQTVNQSANSTTGDGVAGEVVGAVTSAGGSASIVAANRSVNSDVTTGDASSTNDSTAAVGQLLSESDGVFITDISGLTTSEEANLQDGNNTQNARQSAASATGDGVAGQVIGAVSAGATSIDARNTSDNVSIDTGDSNASNDSASFVGQSFADDGDIAVATDVSNITSTDELNVQNGNNRQTLTQTANATTGDGVAGEVIGAVTSAGGSADIVAANTSTNSDVTTGDASADNVSNAFVGQAFSESDGISVGATDVSNITASGGVNVQDGSNRQALGQTATSSTGDGIAGQVLGVVSAGASSVDATNRSDDVSAVSGDAQASNANNALVGLAFSDDELLVAPADISNVDGGGDSNIHDGNNRQTLSQSANAASGDAVSGQVSGVVTSAGGSASAVLANTSSSLDSQSGDSRFDNANSTFVGLGLARGETVISTVGGLS